MYWRNERSCATPVVREGNPHHSHTALLRPDLLQSLSGPYKWDTGSGTRSPASCGSTDGDTSSSMFLRWFLPLLGALSTRADFFQFDSISNVSTYYFNYIYCNIWEGQCQPHQDDATQQGREMYACSGSQWTDCNNVLAIVPSLTLFTPVCVCVCQFRPETCGQVFPRTPSVWWISGTVAWASAVSLETAG